MAMVPVPEHTFATNIIDRVRQAYCGLHGHDSLLQFERDRMFLKCTSCGHESPGWEMNETPPTVTEAQPVRQPRLVRAPQFVGERRVA